MQTESGKRALLRCNSLKTRGSKRVDSLIFVICTGTHRSLESAGTSAAGNKM